MNEYSVNEWKLKFAIKFVYPVFILPDTIMDFICERALPIYIFIYCVLCQCIKSVMGKMAYSSDI